MMTGLRRLAVDVDGNVVIVVSGEAEAESVVVSAVTTAVVSAEVSEESVAVRGVVSASS
jgi:hypothetical protein